MRKTAREIAENGMYLIDSGRIREHKLKETARIHTGEMEQKEQQEYRDFLRGKNGCMVDEME